MINNRKVGTDFEILAINYLKNKGYKILNHQFRCKIGEIDIVISKNNVIIFVEVKYRKNLKNGYPREAVNFKKQQTIRRVAELYLIKNKIQNMDIRFDVIEIVGKEENSIEHLENAF